MSLRVPAMSVCCRSSLRIAFLTLAFALGACGNKGDLVKPAPAPATTQEAAKPAAVPAATPKPSASGDATH